MDVDNRKVDIPVVMMAASLGTRLHFAKCCPLLIGRGKQPIAELIFFPSGFGCRHVIDDCQPRKRGMIRATFRPGKRLYTVDFIDEDVFMGTGGGAPGLCFEGRMIS